MPATGSPIDALREIASRLLRPIGEDLAPRWRRLRKRPFALLISHFASRLLQGEQSTAGDLDLGTGGLLALLAVPGGFASLFLFDKYSTFLNWIRGQQQLDIYTASIPDKYFFLLFSMSVTAIVVVVRWDAILPGRRYYMNFAPLPLSLRGIFFSNLIALTVVATVFAIDVNLASMFLFPTVVTAALHSFTPFVDFFFAHAICLVAASAFTFFACLALIGAMMALLPYRLFRAVSIYVRLTILSGVIVMIATGLRPSWWIPPVWFLGLYQSIQGRATPLEATMASFAVQATAAAFVFALASYFLCYRRYFLRIPEVADGMSAPRPALFPWLTGPLKKLFLRRPVERALYLFTLRTLARSEPHCLVLGGFLSLGLVVAAHQAERDPNVIPLFLGWLGLCGLRLVFEIPVSLEANWIFQALPGAGPLENLAVAREIMLTFLVPFVAAPALVFQGVFQGLFVFLTGAIAMEFLLLGYRKIAFTCARPPFGNEAMLRILQLLFASAVFTFGAATLESWMLASAPRKLALPVIAAAALGAIAWARRDMEEETGATVFRQEAASSAIRLNLLGRG